MVERAEVTVPAKPKSQDGSLSRLLGAWAVVLAELRHWSQRLSYGCQTGSMRWLPGPSGHA